MINKPSLLSPNGGFICILLGGLSFSVLYTHGIENRPWAGVMMSCILIIHVNMCCHAALNWAFLPLTKKHKACACAVVKYVLPNPQNFPTRSPTLHQ